MFSSIKTFARINGQWYHRIGIEQLIHESASRKEVSKLWKSMGSVLVEQLIAEKQFDVLNWLLDTSYNINDSTQRVHEGMQREIVHSVKECHIDVLDKALVGGHTLEYQTVEDILMSTLEHNDKAFTERLLLYMSDWGYLIGEYCQAREQCIINAIIKRHFIVLDWFSFRYRLDQNSMILRTQEFFIIVDENKKANGHTFTTGLNVLGQIFQTSVHGFELILLSSHSCEGILLKVKLPFGDPELEVTQKSTRIRTNKVIVCGEHSLSEPRTCEMLNLANTD